MKTFFTLLLTAVLCLTSCSLAEAPFPALETPAPEEMPAENPGSLSLTLPDRTVVLDYDSDPAHSIIEGGLVQASFFTYAADGTLYELYLLFPEGVSTGDTISTQSCIQSGDNDSGLMLYITTYASELYAAASQYEGAAYPENARYICYFEEVTRTASTVSFAGAFEADLVTFDAQDNPGGLLNGISGAFRFSMEPESAALPSLPDDLPSETTPPDAFSGPSLPALVTPPDAKKI